MSHVGCPMSREALQAQLTVLLAGRAAEQLVLNRVSTAGAAALRRATDLARAMITRYGMSDELATVAFDYAAEDSCGESGLMYGRSARPCSEAVAQRIDRLVQEQVKKRSRLPLSSGNDVTRASRAKGEARHDGGKCEPKRCGSRQRGHGGDGNIYSFTHSQLAQFSYGVYRYTNLADAIAEAKRHPHAG